MATAGRTRQVIRLERRIDQTSGQKSWFTAATVDTLCDPGSPRVRVGALVESSTASGKADSCQTASYAKKKESTVRGET